MLHQRGITADFPLKALELWKPNSVRIRSCLIKVGGMCALSWQGIVVLLSKNNLPPSGDGCPHAMLPRGPLPTGLIVACIGMQVSMVPTSPTAAQVLMKAIYKEVIF